MTNYTSFDSCSRGDGYSTHQISGVCTMLDRVSVPTQTRYLTWPFPRCRTGALRQYRYP